MGQLKNGLKGKRAKMKLGFAGAYVNKKPKGGGKLAQGLLARSGLARQAQGKGVGRWVN